MAEVNPKATLPDCFEYVDLESVIGTEMVSHRQEYKETAPSRAQRLAKEGDLFFQMVRPYQGNNYLFTKKKEDYVFSTGYAQLRPCINGTFLLCLVQSEAFMRDVLERCTGTGYPAINSKDLSNISVFSTTQKSEASLIGILFLKVDALLTLHQRKCDAISLFRCYTVSRIFVVEKGVGTMGFTKELEFEEALIKLLHEDKGWKGDIIEYPTEKVLLDNWAKIIFNNNRQKDRLNDFPLTETERAQIIDKIKEQRTPYNLNRFINGKIVSIARDNPDDVQHLGKEVALDIFDKTEIAAGKSVYQIAKEPIFEHKKDISKDRRGDITLLINGMPVIHIELKRSGIPLSQAVEQIRKYIREGVFTGLYALVQVFVVMTPEETMYFANPGVDGELNNKYFFHWADFNNEPVNDWNRVASDLLSIPMAHQLIGYYSVADKSDGVLKVMRSYQYWAASRILSSFLDTKRESKQRGGYIWHTTGSGKTMTSFKSAQLIADTHKADKVLFVMDRIDLGTQSKEAYSGFAYDDVEVHDTKDTRALIAKLKSNSTDDTLIVTSIQKLSRLKEDGNSMYASDLEQIKKKNIVIIVDEAHRSTCGEEMLTIKDTFKDAIFFGFTGTPMLDENAKKDVITATIFGNELHRYSIADGIRDKNVLGFDPYRVSTFKEKDLREQVALEQAKAKDLDDVFSDPAKTKIYQHFMKEVEMIYEDGDQRGIEDYIPNVQYETEDHRRMVVQDIMDSFKSSSLGKYHAIFATSSILEAIEYYRLLKSEAPDLKITAMFEAGVDDNSPNTVEKIEGLEEIIRDYNSMFDRSFSVSTFDVMKKDIANRLAHKENYKNVPKAKQIDILIVVRQMLTGYDSKWVDILYVDQVMEYANIVQAFSRTNRLFDEDKRFGIIRYYRRPYRMELNIKKAFKLYSGDKPFGIFVDKIEDNIKKMNNAFLAIKILFEAEGISDFARKPADETVCAKFAKLFRELTDYLESARLQGMKWEESKFGKTERVIDERTYNALLLRYQELAQPKSEDNPDDVYPVPYDLDGYLVELHNDKIDTDYMNSRFHKYLKSLDVGISEEEKVEALNDLHRSFATLSQDDQKYANKFIADVQSGSVTLEEGKGFMDYVSEYKQNAIDEKIEWYSYVFGIEAEKMKNIMYSNAREETLNEYGRFDDLTDSIASEKAIEYFSTAKGMELKKSKAKIKAKKMIADFILSGGKDILSDDSE